MPDTADKGENGNGENLSSAAAADDAEDYRVVVAEECFDWREMTDSSLREALDTLAAVLQPLADGRKAAFMGPAYDVECRPSVSLIDALYSPDGGLPRDKRALLQQLLGKCRRVEPDEADLPQPVRVADAPWREPSWGAAHALSRAATGRGMSCLLVSYATEPDWPSGWLTVTRTTETGQDEVKMHVLRHPDDTPGFWRGLLTHESIPAERFFSLVDEAFPRLLFADSLRLHHFKGAYADVLPWLVKLLGALDDHFTMTLAECGGDQTQVVRRFSALGLDISPESPNTKKNAKAWEQRNVDYGGGTFRCEWHGKRLWDRDRVHFSLPIAEYGDRILIGIFVEHLAT
ncbi:hypothetical protein OU787_16780 [Kitasatospora sp. YST-16]|uniref:hypothetical protein n=1 Tax=Kitasatospora sp. YST-16 TaxID=2998080 RepID=UPI00228518D3|nr:hypothetical protein [Kitasatospora sp. YST-16]WAL73013.1 hypothetical protein OU787_16780 [Kitasatospora sp. YST-16]WNW39064.1 hypothetical protein RKE32_16735 [Streptomyces sp. Li-HN-5-13]